MPGAARGGKAYRESMPAPQHKRVEPPADTWPARARQWCRAALGLAILFASLPLAIYEAVVSGEDEQAKWLALILTGISVTVVYLTNRLSRPKEGN